MICWMMMMVHRQREAKESLVNADKWLGRIDTLKTVKRNERKITKDIYFPHISHIRDFGSSFHPVPPRLC